VTLALLWQEYRVAHLDGYAYRQFGGRYRQWRRGTEAVDAAGASRRREAVCGLLWHATVPGRFGHGRRHPVKLFVGVV
jgi:hypothetical protein